MIPEKQLVCGAGRVERHPWKLYFEKLVWEADPVMRIMFSNSLTWSRHRGLGVIKCVIRKGVQVNAYGS